MQRALILDKPGRCSGCEFSVPGPSKILVAGSPCVWCERNPYLFTEIQDNYKKQDREVKLELKDVPDDTNPALGSNKKFLKNWGITYPEKGEEHGKRHRK